MTEIAVPKYEVVAARLERELLEKLRAYAVDNERTVSAEIRLAVRAYLKERT